MPLNGVRIGLMIEGNTRAFGVAPGSLTTNREVRRSTIGHLANQITTMTTAAFVVLSSTQRMRIAGTPNLGILNQALTSEQVLMLYNEKR